MTKVSPLEWKWRRWRMRVGEYRGYTGRRPLVFPRTIPPAWFVRLAAFQARERLKDQQTSAKTCASPIFMTRNGCGGALWRQSDSEDVDRAYRAGLRWALLQLGADDFRPLTTKLERLGVPWGWWFHCRNVEDLDWLLDHSIGKPIIGINVEKELETLLRPVVVRERIEASIFRGQVSIVPYGWVQNDVVVTDADLGLYPWLLEMFPSDNPDLSPPVETLTACVAHAKRLGVRFPCQLMQTYHGAKPWWYDRQAIPNSIYTADDIDDRWEGWF